MGRKSKKEIRQKEILEACYSLIEREGIDGITLKKIGKSMDVAPSLIMHYFQNKEELLLALVDFMLEKMDTVYMPYLASFKTARERLEFFLEETINLYIAQSVSDPVWYSCFGLSMHDPQIREGFKRVYDRDLQISEKLIKEYLEEQGIEDVDPKILSVKLISLVEGLNILHATYGESALFKKAIRDFKQDFMAMFNRVPREKQISS